MIRRLLGLDAPEHHLSGRQFAFALVTLALSAALWWNVTRLWFVPATVMSLELLNAYASQRAEERPLRRIARSFLAGGIWAAVGVLVFGRTG